MKATLFIKRSLSVFLCVALALSFCSAFSGRAEAAISLPAIEKIKDIDEEFEILEIVPEDTQGSIGYYIDGAEPWVALAGEKPSKAERADFVNNKLQTLLNQAYPHELSENASNSEKKAYYSEYFELALCEPANKNGSIKDEYPLSFVGDYDEVCPWEKAAKPNAYSDYEKQMQLVDAEEGSAVGTMEYVGDGKGDYIAVGRVSNNSYSYIGEGNGGYSFVPSSDGIRYNLSTRTVYYTGGFRNNNWFLKYVFDYDEFEIGQETLNISVNTVTADKATVELINSADMIVLNYGLDINTKSSSTYSSVFKNDFPADIAAANLPGISAAARAKENPTPVIFDYNLINSSNTAVRDTAKLLLNTASGSRSNSDFITEEQHSFVGGSIYCSDVLGRIVRATDGQSEVTKKGLPLATADFIQPNLDGENGFEEGRAFNPVYEEIYYGNFLRKLRDKHAEETGPNITTASIIKHIINYTNTRQILPKTSVNVLDLERGVLSMTKAQRAQLTKALAESAGIAESEISLMVTSMPISTFNCIKRDICEDYDLLYIGDDSGLSAYSGAKIEEFAGSGYPVIIADEMSVDDSSQMHKTISSISDKTNVMRRSALQSKGVQQALLFRFVSISEPEIVFWNDNYPTLYSMDDSGVMNSLADDRDGIYSLEYVFKINNDSELSPETTRYECRLFIDSDGNGLYEEDEEVPEIEIYEWNVYSESYGSSGSRVENTQLEGSYGSSGRNQHHYYLSHRLPANTVGVVPWKIEVRNTAQFGGYDSIEEFSRIAPTVPNVINVLQIDSVDEDSQLNLQENIQNGGIYKELSDKISSDFILNIGTIKSDFINEPVDNNTSYNYFTEGEGNVRVETLLSSSEDKFTKTKTTIAGNASTTEIEEFGTIAELFESYDVLILGFGYDYSELNSELKSAVEEYIKSERPLIVAHNPASRSEESGDDSVRALSLGGIVDSETGGNGKKLTQLNKGQITSYPFDINTKAFKEEGYKPEQFDSISLKSVQEQSYNLNTRGDEVLAWYYLERDENNSEGSNELYAYSLGNVTYMDLGQASGSAEVSEAKLLINTMVAAYQLENGVSEISFSNENGSVTGIEDFFMVTDGDLILSTNSKYDDFNRRIYFTPNDTYAGENKVMSASFAYNNGQPFKLPIYEAASKQLVSDTLLSGSTYYIKFDDIINALGADISLNNPKLKIILSTSYEGATIKSENDLTLRQFKLFDLS